MQLYPTLIATVILRINWITTVWLKNQFAFFLLEYSSEGMAMIYAMLSKFVMDTVSYEAQGIIVYNLYND